MNNARTITAPAIVAEFGPAEKQAVYDVIALRRDIRNFRPDDIPDGVLDRLLRAAHAAPSVGFMQPWDFVVIRSPERKGQCYELFREANERAASHYDGDKHETYLALKLQGILDAPLCICVTCDTTRGGPHVLGRDSVPEMDRYSVCLAVENFWLAARAEGVGVGWMSIVDNSRLASVLALPTGVVPIAFLCVGYPVEFPATPMLASTGWREREPLANLVHYEHWGQQRRGEDDRIHANPARPGAHASEEFAADERLDEQVPATLDAAERRLAELLSSIEASDPAGARAERVQRRLDQLAKPPGSLGRLERLAIQLACAQGRDVPSSLRKRVLVFAADHGVTDDGVSAYQASVTARLCYNMMSGGATINALLRPGRVPLEVIDVGVKHTFDRSATLRHSKIAYGTRNLACEPAMTRLEVLQALNAGASAVREGPAADVIALGEVGIGNTTAAAALLALLTGADETEVVGNGTGIGPQTKARKAAAVTRAVRRAQPALSDVLELVAESGGLEIAALAGAILGAASRRIPVLLDGFIVGAAALIAHSLAPATSDYTIASHRSAERGHAIVLDRLLLEPLLQLDLRLGEASGAALALPLVDAACVVLRDVRTFQEAGIEPPIDERGAV